MPPPLHLDLAAIDLSQIVADKEEIQRHNPQRYEMEQLDAIVYVDGPNQLVVGYKDLTPNEFWIRGHMPGYPLMPGVLICEAAAQLCSYYVCTHGLQQGDFMGFAGMENVRFRTPVRPGDRLILVAKGKRLKSRQMIFDVQGFVGTTMVFHGDIIGMALTRGE